MSPSRRNTALDDWLDHGEFLRRLARRLVSDHHAAEDLAQDAQLAALTDAPQQPEARRAWYVRVLRNLSANLRRGRRRRGARERAASRREATPGPDEIRARLEVQSRIVALVGSLEEPYRTTVYLRFYEDLPPRAIAARQNVSVHTVKTRLQRALGQLRVRLDRDFGGDRGAWCAVLLPLTFTSGTLAATAPNAAVLGGIVMKTAVAVGLAALAVLGLLYLPSGSEPVFPPAEVAGTEPVAQEPEAAIAETQLPDIARLPLAAEPSESTSFEADWILVGRVLDRSGLPIAGARIAAELEPSRQGVTTTSDEHGAYTLAVDLPPEISTWASVSLQATADAEGYGPEEQRLPNLRSSDEGRQELVVDFTLSEQRHARGKLVDVRGDAAEGALVALIDEDGAVITSGRTGGDGTFQLVLGDRRQVWMAAGSAASGCAFTGPHDVPEVSDVDLGTTALQAYGVLEGTVTLPDGTPVADTAVKAQLTEPEAGVGTLLDEWLDQAQQTGTPPPRAFAGNASGNSLTDEQGRFRLDGLAPGSYELELVGIGGWVPRDRLRAGPYRTGEHAQVVFEAYRLHARVLDHEGLAVPGADLMVGDGDRWSVRSSGGLDASATFDVIPGSWLVTASLEGARPIEHSLEVIEGRYEYEVDLLLDFEPATGELQILVTDELQQAVKAFGINLWLQDSSTAVADFSGLEPDSDGVLPPIPTGYYRVRATFPAQPGRVLEQGRPRRLGDHFSVDTFATVREGERSTVRLTTQRGSRLRLWIEPEAQERVPVYLTREDVQGGETRRVGHLMEQVGARQNGSSPALGVSGFSDLIRPGTYVLRATAEGYEDFEQTIGLRPGEVTELRIRMQARD